MIVCSSLLVRLRARLLADHLLGLDVLRVQRVDVGVGHPGRRPRRRGAAAGRGVRAAGSRRAPGGGVDARHGRRARERTGHRSRPRPGAAPATAPGAIGFGPGRLGRRDRRRPPACGPVARTAGHGTRDRPAAPGSSAAPGAGTTGRGSSAASGVRRMPAGGRDHRRSASSPGRGAGTAGRGAGVGVGRRATTGTRRRWASSGSPDADPRRADVAAAAGRGADAAARGSGSGARLGGASLDGVLGHRREQLSKSRSSSSVVEDVAPRGVGCALRAGGGLADHRRAASARR